MSEQAVPTVRGFYEALAAGNAPAALGILGVEIEWHEAPGMPYAGDRPHRGPAEVAERVLGPINADVEGLALSDLDFRGLGTTVVVLGRYRGRGRQTGSTLDLPFAHVWRLEGGTPVEFRQYTDAAAFVDAVSPMPAEGSRR